MEAVDLVLKLKDKLVIRYWCPTEMGWLASLNLFKAEIILKNTAKMKKTQSCRDEELEAFEASFISS